MKYKNPVAVKNILESLVLKLNQEIGVAHIYKIIKGAISYLYYILMLQPTYLSKQLHICPHMPFVEHGLDEGGREEELHFHLIEIDLVG